MPPSKYGREHKNTGSAREARATGSLWNAMVLVAKGTQLWSLGWTCFPEMMSRFEQMKKAIDTTEELRVLDAIYETMSCRNFSSHLLQYATEQLAVMEMKDVLWSDLRIADTLDKTGKPLAFAEEPLSFLY
jgi:mannose-1-phosphate guanylyltransferase